MIRIDSRHRYCRASAMHIAGCGRRRVRLSASLMLTNARDSIACRVHDTCIQMREQYVYTYIDSALSPLEEGIVQARKSWGSFTTWSIALSLSLSLLPWNMCVYVCVYYTHMNRHIYTVRTPLAIVCALCIRLSLSLPASL